MAEGSRRGAVSDFTSHPRRDDPLPSLVGTRCCASATVNPTRTRSTASLRQLQGISLRFSNLHQSAFLSRVAAPKMPQLRFAGPDPGDPDYGGVGVWTGRPDFERRGY